MPTINNVQGAPIKSRTLLFFYPTDCTK